MGLFDLFKRKTIQPQNPVAETQKAETSVIQQMPVLPIIDPDEKAEVITRVEPVNDELARRRDEMNQRYLEKTQRYNEIKSNIMSRELIAEKVGAPKQAIGHLSDLTYSNITKKSSLEKLGDFVVIDTETTGLQATSCEIIDIAAIRFRNFIPVEKVSMLLSTKKPIPEDATKVNGITNEMVLGCPRFSQIAVSLVDFIGDDAVVGHNLEFDLKFVVKHGADLTSKKRKYYDTLELAQKTLKKPRYKYNKEYGYSDYDFDSNYDVLDYKLNTLCVYYGIITDTLHRAEADALATGFLFEKLAKQRTGALL